MKKEKRCVNCNQLRTLNNDYLCYECEQDEQERREEFGADNWMNDEQ